MHILDLVDDRANDAVNMPIRDTKGTLAGYILVYKAEAEDGTVCTQLELRFAGKPSSLYYSGVGVDTPRYASRREGILVTLEPRTGELAPMRFSIDIPGESSETGDRNGNEKASPAAVLTARAAIQEVRRGCKYTNGCDYPVCDLAPYRSGGELANDGCSAVMVPLPS